MSEEDNKNYVGDNIRVRTNMYADLTNSTVIDSYWKKPKAADPTTTEIVTKACQIEDAVNGIVYYDTLDTDLDVVGEYRQQVKVTFADSKKIKSAPAAFVISSDFE